MHAFTRNIKRLIEKAGGQAELADEIGTSQSAVSRWNSGVLPRDRDLMEAAANYAGVSVDHLFTLPIDAPASPTAITGPIVMLPVSFPNAAALTRMFEAMLEKAVADEGLRDEIAQMLAARLPGALARASTAPPVEVHTESRLPDEVSQPLAKRHQPRRPESRT